jgi:hypothetical protein
MNVSDIQVRKASNGYILEFYAGDSEIIIFETFAEAAKKMEELFES